MKSLMQRITDRQTIVCLVFLFFFMPTLAEDKDSVKTEVYATYYADRFHGRRTSNGEKYDKDAYSCAHRKLPFGTLVRVTNPKNGKTAVVRVNDRGPYGKRAKIDLSKAAARDIGMLSIGIIKVEMEVLADSIEYEYKQINDTIK
jgi:rare lipoprotein A